MYREDSFAALLIKAGASPDAVEPESGNSLLHLAAMHGYQSAGIFLTKHRASVGQPNFKANLTFYIFNNLLSTEVESSGKAFGCYLLRFWLLSLKILAVIPTVYFAGS